MISEQIKQAILTLQNRYPQKRSALVPALHLVQQQLGYLPPDAQKEVAELFTIDATEVQAMVSFYDMFYDKPVGKHIIHVCKNASCMLRGSDSVLEGLCKKLNVEPGEKSADGEFTIIASECLGACDRAPMMIVNDTVVGPVKVEDLDGIIEDAQKSSGHPSPVCMGDASHG